MSTDSSPNSFPEKISLLIESSFSGLRLDQLLVKLYPSISRSRLARAVREGLACLDGNPAKPADRVQAGQVLDFIPPQIQSGPGLAPDFDLEILYQDQEVFVINKPPALMVHPAENWSGVTLTGALLVLDPHLKGVGPEYKPGLVHRLDRDTSGVMVVARSEVTRLFLSEAFKERQVTKKYLAFVHGSRPDGGVICSPIGRHPSRPFKMATGIGGRQAKTIYKIVRRFERTGLSLVLVTLLTGRTHQARVHLASVDLPVLGDRVYGKGSQSLIRDFPELSPYLQRQLLHARRLVFPHPDGSLKTVWAPWPQDFVSLFRLLVKMDNSPEKI